MLTSSNQVPYILAVTALGLTGQPTVTKCGPYNFYAAGLNTPDKLWSLAELE